MKTDNSLLIFSALTVAIVCWGLSFVVTKIALESFTPFALIFLRFSIAAVFFIGLLQKTGWPVFNRNNITWLISLSFMQPVLYFSFETYGLQYTSATKTSLMIATIPVVVLVLSSLILKEKLRPLNIFGILLSLSGVSLLVFSGAESVSATSDNSMLGDLLIVGAVLSASLYTILTRKLGTLFTSIQITGMQVIIGALLFFPAFLFDMKNMEWGQVTTEGLGALAVLTVFATIGAFLCFNYALTRIPAARAAVFLNGIPLITIFGAWVLLGETLSSLQIVGGGIVLIAVVLANHEPRKKTVITDETVNAHNS